MSDILLRLILKELEQIRRLLIEEREIRNRELDMKVKVAEAVCMRGHG